MLFVCVSVLQSSFCACAMVCCGLVEGQTRPNLWLNKQCIDGFAASDCMWTTSAVWHNTADWDA